MNKNYKNTFLITLELEIHKIISKKKTFPNTLVKQKIIGHNHSIKLKKNYWP